MKYFFALDMAWVKYQGKWVEGNVLDSTMNTVWVIVDGDGEAMSGNTAKKFDHKDVREFKPKERKWVA